MKKYIIKEGAPNEKKVEPAKVQKTEAEAYHEALAILLGVEVKKNRGYKTEPEIIRKARETRTMIEGGKIV